MRNKMCAALLIAGTLFGGTGWAQDRDPELDEAWATYQSATIALARGDAASARVLLETLRRDHPDHLAAKLAASVLEMLGGAEEPGGAKEMFAPPSIALPPSPPASGAT